MELDQEQSLAADSEQNIDATKKENDRAKGTLIKALNGQANVFPGLSQNQIKQVQRKKALESGTNQQPAFANQIGAEAGTQQLRLKQRKMTEDDRKVRFMED